MNQSIIFYKTIQLHEKGKPIGQCMKPSDGFTIANRPQKLNFIIKKYKISQKKQILKCINGAWCGNRSIKNKNNRFFVKFIDDVFVERTFDAEADQNCQRTSG
jgi:hypothetical protein